MEGVCVKCTGVFDETLAVLAMIPFIGYFFRKIHAWYHTKMGHVCHEKHCEDKHVDHPYSPFERKDFQIVSEEDMEYLQRDPAPLHITIPNIVIWDPISEEDVIERFSITLVGFMYEEARDAGYEDVTSAEVNWYVNQKAELRAEVRNKAFLHDHETCEYGWREDEKLF